METLPLGGATIPPTITPIDGSSGVKIPAERSGCYRVEGDFVAQPFQTPHKTTLDELTIPLIEVIAT
jgi:hypothetical protein